MATLSLRGVSKLRGDRRTVARVSLDVADGEFLVILGPSGCGKSTLLRMVAGLESISEGEILIDGHVVNDVSPKDRDVAMVFQNYALYPHMTVRDNLSFGLRMRGVSTADVEAAVGAAAKALELTPLLDRRPKALSGGQQQRVALGRALVRRPKIFLFDEPLSNLDARLRMQTRGELLRLHKRLQATMVYVTHDQTEAMSLADRILLLKDGVVQQLGPPAEIYDEPVNRFVAAFLGAPPMNFVSARLEETGEGVRVAADGFGFAWGRVAESAPPLVGPAVLLGIRPEELHATQLTPPPAGAVTLRLTADIVESLGSDIVVTGNVGSAALTARLSPRAAIGVDQLIDLWFDPGRVCLFDDSSGERIA